MPTPSLSQPDRPEWHDEPDYSPEVAAALRRAYITLSQRDASPAAPLRAHSTIHQHLDLPMSRHQRLAFWYVLALGYAAAADYEHAAYCTDEAMDSALSLGEYGALVELHYLRGGIQRSVLHLEGAASDYRDCLLLLREFPEAGVHHNRSFEVTLLTELAGFEFYRARYVETAALLRQAEPLARRLKQDSLPVATLAWMETHLYRWRGDPFSALERGTEAATLFTERGSTASAARIQAVTADCALDAADDLPPGSARERLIATAHTHASLSFRLAREARDEIGMLFASLPLLRHARIAGRNKDRVSSLENILREGQRLKDEAIVIQALTTLGDELAALGEVESARTHYVRALIQASTSEATALALFPRRGLRQLDER